MTLHVFNPEHDLALAANLSNFTSPHAGRQLRTDLGFLPAIWSAEDDYVLVDDPEKAQEAYNRLMQSAFPRFVEKHQLSHLAVDNVEPWGWDLALRRTLLRYGVSMKACPSEGDIAVIRDLSHRRTAVALLRSLSSQLGGSFVMPVVTSQLFQCESLVAEWGKTVVKAPWSSSGRGVRFVDNPINDYQARWIRNVIERQGSVVVEPFYDKVKDFAMEFESDGNGSVTCLGLSLFHTSNGAYTGNVLASEENKLEMLSAYISRDLLHTVQENICQFLGLMFKGRYKGPLGVDMMVVASDARKGFILHPCVEINLRRTMGHVALELSKQCLPGQVMVIDYADSHYSLEIR